MKIEDRSKKPRCWAGGGKQYDLVEDLPVDAVWIKVSWIDTSGRRHRSLPQRWGRLLHAQGIITIKAVLLGSMSFALREALSAPVRGFGLLVQAGGRGLEDAAGGQPHADFVASAACKLSQSVASCRCGAVFGFSDASCVQDMMPQP